MEGGPLFQRAGQGLLDQVFGQSVVLDDRARVAHQAGSFRRQPFGVQNLAHVQRLCRCFRRTSPGVAGDAGQVRMPNSV